MKQKTFHPGCHSYIVTPMTRIDIAIFTAIPDEATPILKRLAGYPCKQHHINNFEFPVYDYQGKQILVTSTGLGTAFASMVVTMVAMHFKPENLLYCGTAGAVSDEAHIRDIIVVNEAFEVELQGLASAIKDTPFADCLRQPLKNQTSPQTYHADTRLLSIATDNISGEAKIIIGKAATSNLFPAPQSLFVSVKQANALAIDMETSAFYQAAWLFNFPALAIRGVSNKLNSDGTDDNIDSSDTVGSMQVVTDYLFRLIERI